jgi:hypothetical protein
MGESWLTRLSQYELNLSVGKRSAIRGEGGNGEVSGVD